MPATAADTDADTFRIADNWGPWSEHMTPAERRESILVLRTVASLTVGVGRQHPLWKALFRAYAAADDAAGARGLALLEAAHEVERLPALTRRNLIGSYAGNMLLSDEHRAPRKGRPEGRCRKSEPKGAAA